MLLEHCIRCSSVPGALGSGNVVSLPLYLRARDQRMNAVIKAISLLSVSGKSLLTRPVGAYTATSTSYPTLCNSQALLPVAPLSMLAWLCDNYQNFIYNNALSSLNGHVHKLTRIVHKSVH